MTKHDPDIEYQSIAEMAPRIQSGELSPVDIIEVLLRRISQLEPSLKAFLTVWSDSARTAARLAESEIKSGRYIGPLHGIPIG
ncbi:MAG: amidase family protein, partial [Chloroflexota bacterium]|nr:amidase family protein [Chloroflexota bacterium]